ncbi:hypothetical protein JCM31826_11000 [Thermaurantimonas aggregans]|uniref:DUF4270 domain-containing protein n=1 Tax=Thermaurantimonas aggregans TaxID=2173829 RepID=A0A401XKT3_9FLAO|nr:DUF4270 family protein [Thermaurantimonas aggregans]MCX8148188.1 DUF4270 domain-containing protein [Thermaurantimonas aggregans]GCD77618.1 hypothetical protein JCM31826_11000 [Thermaurantimonas aggregans]
MKNIRKAQLLQRTLIIMCPFLFFSCEKDLGSLGLDQIQDQKADFLFTDSIPFVTYTGFDDSIPTSLTGRLLLGRLYSSEFGESKSAFATNFLLEQINPTFPANAVLDSVELTLRYLGHYGDTSVPMHIKVYKLEDRLYLDSTYYSNHMFTKGQLLGEATIVPRPNTRVPRGNDTISPLLIIKLDKDFFKTAIIDHSRTNASDFANQDAFMNYFKGIYVEALSGNSILYFNPFQIATAIRLYFRDSDTNTIFRTFRLQGDNSPVPINAVVNVFSNDYSGSQIRLNQDTINGEATTYIAAMNGPYTVVKFTDFSLLRQPGVVLNKFEIVLPIKPGIEGNHISPPRVSALVIDSTGKQTVIKDESFTSPEFSGVLTRGRFRYASYTITLTRQVSESILKSTSTLKIAIKAQNGISTANRTAIVGNANPDLKPIIKVYYTKF